MMTILARGMASTLLLCLASGVAAAQSPDPQQLEKQYQSVHFQYHAGGSFWIGLIPILSSDEAKLLGAAACSYYLGPQICGPLGQLDQQLKKDAYAKLVKPTDGTHEHSGAIRAPDGMKMCRVDIPGNKYKLSQHATFNISLQDNAHQFAYYAFVRGGGQNDDIDVTVVFKMVPDTASDPSCLHPANPKTQAVWLCGEKAYKSSECAQVLK